jgi:proline iminopeptidase
LHGSASEAEDAATRWGAYEDAVMQAMSGKLTASTDSAVKAPAASARAIGKYRIQAHYLLNAGFTSEADLRSAAEQMAHTPTIIVHGTHDLVCPPENAAHLTRMMPHARLQWVPKGGHTPADPLIAAALRDAVATLRDAL